MIKITFLILFTSQLCFSKAVVKINLGHDYSKYTNADLRHRVWTLERAVWQLQQKVFELQAIKPQSSGDTWVCTLKAMADSFTATGGSKAVAKSRVIEKCTKKRGNGFFCVDPKCEN